jgi:hypothetical protein
VGVHTPDEHLTPVANEGVWQRFPVKPQLLICEKRRVSRRAQMEEEGTYVGEGVDLDGTDTGRVNVASSASGGEAVTGDAGVAGSTSNSADVADGTTAREKKPRQHRVIEERERIENAPVGDVGVDILALTGQRVEGETSVTRSRETETGHALRAAPVRPGGRASLVRLSTVVDVRLVVRRGSTEAETEDAERTLVERGDARLEGNRVDDGGRRASRGFRRSGGDDGGEGEGEDDGETHGERTEGRR